MDSTFHPEPSETIAPERAPADLAALAAEIRGRVVFPHDPNRGLLYHPRVPEGFVDNVARNAACVVGELRARGMTSAQVRADVDAFAKPFLRGLLGWSNANSDENPHVERDMQKALDGLLDAIVDLAAAEAAP